ncbi:hypothetical protein L6R52_29875 [Myxococcota bacterium]|nr:hypothetical protein [Myxococcota bacterium]
MPNAIAWAAIWLFPMWGLALFFVLPPRKAFLIVFMAGLLTLPERLVLLDPPLLPPLLKNEITGIVCLLGLALRAPTALTKAVPGRGIDALIFVLVIGAWMTALTNTSPLVYGPSVFPALGVSDAIAMSVIDVITVFIPFTLARAMFRTADDIRDFMKHFVGAFLLYTIIFTYEVRMSPQTHHTFYGYHQHQFIQSVRSFGFYRPLAFMPHGLALAIFYVSGLNMLLLTQRLKVHVFISKQKWLPYGLYGIFLLAQSAGAAAFSLISLPALKLLKPKLLSRLALVLAIALISYPVTKLSGLFPAEGIVELAKAVNEDRASSLEDRMENDAFLMSKAREALFFGWGAYGRNRVTDNNGRDVAIPDGWWVMTLGERGAVGLACMLGFLLLPLLAASKALKKTKDEWEQLALGGLSLIQLFYCLDLLPNDLYNPFPLFIGGALTGFSEEIIRRKKQPVAAQPKNGKRAAAPVQVRVQVVPPQPLVPQAPLPPR